jgi:hypothetical protein
MAVPFNATRRQMMATQEDKQDEGLAQLKERLEETSKENELLRTKNRELADEKRATKTGAERQLADATEKVEELTAQLAKVQADSDKKMKALQTEYEGIVKSLESEKGANVRLLVENGLTEALTKAGVLKELLPAARALLREKGIIAVEADGDLRKAVATLKVDGKETKVSIEDYVSKHFAATDEGKAFVSASHNSGAGAGGASGVPGSAKTELAEKYSKAVKDGNADLALALKGQMSQVQ